MIHMLDRLRSWARELILDVQALALAWRDPAVGLSAKTVALITVIYALSPIDLIPDVIPVLGQLDDVILIPAGIWLSRQLIADPIFSKWRMVAGQQTAGGYLSIAGLFAVLFVWMALCWLAYSQLWRA